MNEGGCVKRSESLETAATTKIPKTRGNILLRREVTAKSYSLHSNLIHIENRHE
jgi:hypothetical protein